jgi:peptidoglycan hydrolase-like protein with peptidoglycan-binding domain
MDIWYPGAERRPLGAQSENPIRPRIFVVHTMVGHLRGTDGMFRRGGYDGTESHFGIGGPQDPELDGAVYQWQRLDYSADAQAAGNVYCTSVETADGGDPDNPWSDAQLLALVKLGTWWARNVDAPARIVTSTSQHGFSYHRAFDAWNPNKHSCPGTVRLRQYTNVVIPAIAKQLTAAREQTKPSAPTLGRTVGVGDNGDDVRAVQILVRVKPDGAFGPITAAAVVVWQQRKNLTADGMFGPACARAAGWTWKG